ncbi:hypothetical protein MMC29_002266 [Sticta canariensis]|nr:hypothetical protein [Sticta canariensis]
MHFASLLSLFATFAIVVVGSPSKVKVVAARADPAGPYVTCTGSTEAAGVNAGPQYLSCCSKLIGGAGNVPAGTGVNCTKAPGAITIGTKGKCTDPYHPLSLYCSANTADIPTVGTVDTGCTPAKEVDP